MGLIRPPIPDASLDVFDRGVGVLTLDGEVVGHVATSRSWFWSPFSPLRKQWWIWYIVIWADGVRERSAEDYPPFIAAEEMKRGSLEVLADDATRSGTFDFEWLSSADGEIVRRDLDIQDSDF